MNHPACLFFQNEVETVVSDTEDEIDELFKSQLSDAPQITPTPGGPFSALTPSMWPQDILLKLAESKENSSSDQEQRFKLHSLSYICFSAICIIFKLDFEIGFLKN